MLRLRFLLALAAVLSVTLPSRAFAAGAPAAATTAKAAAPAGPRPMYVLTIDTDDADEQADAMSSALRSRIRLVQGNAALGETPSSLSMLVTALRCPPNPDTSCLNKIADTLKTDRFIWGKMARAAKAQVTVDLHLYVRSQPDVVLHETYSENLKEANDETLRVLAGKLYDRLTGTMSTGVVHVHAGAGAGSVIVDGERRAKLENGLATMELAVGVHAVEIRVPGSDTIRQQITVVGGEDGNLDVTLAPTGTTDSPQVPVRRIAAYGAIGLGVVSGVVSVLFASKYGSDSSSASDDRKLYTGTADCADHGGPSSAACTDRSNGQRDSALAWTFGGVGAGLIAAGVVLIVTEPKNEEASAPPASANRLRVLPTFGPHASGLTLVGGF